MTRTLVPDLEKVLARRLSDARRVAIVGIGDELSRHDRLGILAARDLDALRLPAVKVFLAGTLPESFTGPIRRWKPDHVVLIDAADMGARPGTVAVIGAQDIRGSRLSTHALPLSLVIRYLESDLGIRVTLVGIQPDLTANAAAPTAAEVAGLTRVVATLHRLLGPLGSRGGGKRASGRSEPPARRTKRKSGPRAPPGASSAHRPRPESRRARRA